MRVSSFKPVHELIAKRWSPRAFLSDPVSDEDLKTILEAARFAPSCFNDQPWLFAVANGGERLQAFQSVLVSGNQVWANQAPVLIIVFANKRFGYNDKPNRWAAFDAGAAWMSLALQALSMGYVTHAMGGFNADKAYEVTGVSSEKYEAMAMVALGRQADPSVLSPDLQEKEVLTERKSLSDIVQGLSF